MRNLSALSDPLWAFSYACDEIAVNHENRLVTQKGRMHEILSFATGFSVGHYKQCDENLLFDAAAFVDTFRPGRSGFFKGRLGNKRNMGVRATTGLLDRAIELALADRDERTGFYSTSEQWQISINVRLREGSAWMNGYIPKKLLRRTVHSISIRMFGCWASVGFRLPDGVMLVWLLDRCVDSEALTSSLRKTLPAQESIHPGVSCMLVGTQKSKAMIPHRGDMVDGQNLLPLRFENQLTRNDPVAILGSMPTKDPIDETDSIPRLNGIDPRLKHIYRAYSRTILTYYSRRRTRTIIRLFRYIWKSFEDAHNKRVSAPIWVGRKYGPGCFPLSSKVMRRLDDSYTKTLKLLADLGVLLPVGNYSHGQACYDPHPRFFFLDASLTLKAHRGPQILERVLSEYPLADVAVAANVTPRTVRNWKRHPETMSRAIAEQLDDALQPFAKDEKS